MTESILTRLSLEVEYKAGLDKDGKDVFRKFSISNIKEEASDDSIGKLGNAIGSLLDTQIYRVSKATKHEIITF
ncbi:DUF1659 domain-containing protein [Clostridium intestinale]|jgi:hypothetical protein|uniref:DUF1659 domain-containing protein n=1 Tax=Clostridium intestinale DSM 6191 TaxID=1121320 RepID=A0A1M6FHA0_9CLOT|nr:DUF1659 domain-containing protein [Clostridium intestinale]SHI97047.1 Protein of unknown function [Clostridium intestinale DSM 6191]